MKAQKKISETLTKRSLSAPELQEFQLRHQAVMIATHQQMLVKEAYDTWLAAKGTAYGVNGKFDVNLRTGEITEHA